MHNSYFSLKLNEKCCNHALPLPPSGLSLLPISTGRRSHFYLHFESSLTPEKPCKHYVILRHCAYFCCCPCFGIKNINVSTRFDQIHQLFHKILSINIILKSIKGHSSLEKFKKTICISHNMDHIYQCINKILSKSIH